MHRAVSCVSKTVFLGARTKTLTEGLYTSMAGPSPPVFLTEVPARKTWWAKRVTSSVYIAGRLSERQIKGAAEDCFKSIVFMFNNKREGQFGDQRLPPTEEALDVAKKSCDLQTGVLCSDLDLDDDEQETQKWCTLETITKFVELLKKLPLPLLFCSNTGYSAAFISLSWLLIKTNQDADPEDRLSGEEFYDRAVGLGFDFTPLKNIIDLINGVKVMPQKPDLTIPKWHQNYWPARPVYKNWYVVGQVQTDHKRLLEELGTDFLLNTRLGNVTDGKKTQEEVTLLNVGETSKTYTGAGRQTSEELERHRIDKSKPSSYISGASTVNYETTNPLEFGDEIGYNETLQKELMETAPFEYIHMPIVSHGYKIEMYEEYKDQWLELSKKGNVVSQCRTGHRAAVAAVVTLAKEHGKTSQWAQDKLWAMGYRVNTTDDPDVFILLQHVLGPIS